MNCKHYFRMYMIELDQSRSRCKLHNAKLDKIKVIKIWQAKWVILNLHYCSRIFKMVCTFLGWIIDSFAPNDRKTL